MRRPLLSTALGLSALLFLTLAPADAQVKRAKPKAKRAAQEAPPPVDLTAPVPVPDVPGPRLSVGSVVDATLRSSPEVQRAAATLAQRRGTLREATGAFDRTFGVTSNLDYNRLDLTASQTEGEIERRLRFELPAEKLDSAAAEIAQHLPTAGSLLFSDCRNSNTVIQVNLDNGQPPVFVCFDSNNQVIGFVFDNQATGLSSVGSSAFTRLLLFDSLAKNGFAISLDTQKVLDGFSDLLRFLSRQLHLAADSLRLQRIELGDVPVEQDSIVFQTDVSYQWRFRTGVSITPMLSLQANEDHYDGKTLNPRFGDTLVPNLQTVTLGLTLNLPLGKGRGKVSADAPELAALEAVKSAEHLLAHTASEQALSVVEGYLDVAAAEERLRLLVQSAGTQERIYNGTVELAKGEQVATLDVTRSNGRLAQSRAAVAAARQDLTSARLALQRLMGVPLSAASEAPLPLETLEALLAQDPPTDVDPERLVGQALSTRNDLRAAEEAARANRILAEGARADLKRQIDLSLNASYNGIHESVRERWYDLYGYARAVGAKIAGPSYGATLHVSLPFGNNEAQGRLLQADASLSQSDIAKTDLRRTIRVRVLELQGALNRSRVALTAAKRTLDLTDETLRASGERFRGGDLSVIDTLTTEDQATQARLAWVDAARTHLGLLAQLRFEANALLAAAPGTTDPRSFQLAPLGSPLL